MMKFINNIIWATIQIILIIFVVTALTLLIASTGCSHTCEVHRKPEAPKNLAPTLDSVIAVDSVELMLSKDPDMMYSFPPEYHGKEGKSEFGEYQSIDDFDWGDQGECGD